MTRRLSLATAWIAVGHAAVLALFWALVNVPESSAGTLTLSALLVALIVFVAGWVQTSGLALCRDDGALLRSLARGLRTWPAFIPGVVLFFAAWWLTGLAGDWLGGHRGEIDAWLLLRLKWTRTAALHSAVGWILAFARYPIAIALSLAAVSAAQARPGTLGRLRWVREAGGWRSIGIATALSLVFLWLPWQFVYWRPRSMPPTWIEVAFSATKLLLLYLWAQVGWALLLWNAAGRTIRRPEPGPS